MKKSYVVSLRFVTSEKLTVPANSEKEAVEIVRAQYQNILSVDNVEEEIGEDEFQGASDQNPIFPIKSKPKTYMLLQHLEKTARAAYYGTSFSPEARAKTIVSDYSAELEQDLEEIKTSAPEFADTYQQRYERALSSWLSSMSRIVSPMIAGPSNFPSRRMEKYRGWEDNKYRAFRSWREKALKAVKRAVKKSVDPLEAMRGKLKEAQDTQEYMKKINSVHATFKKKGLEWLEAQDLSEAAKKVIMSYEPQYSWIKHPFAPYQLTNNGANIRRMEERVKELEAKEEKKNTEQPDPIKFNGGEILLNYELDRLQIMFPGKPDENIRTALKKNGFKWAPSQSAWQRQITYNAKFYTVVMIKELFGTEIKL